MLSDHWNAGVHIILGSLTIMARRKETEEFKKMNVLYVFICIYIYMHACILKKFRRKLLFYFWVTTCIMYLCMCIYISACNFLMDLFIVDISRWFKNTWCKRRTSCDTMLVKQQSTTHILMVYPCLSHHIPPISGTIEDGVLLLY